MRNLEIAAIFREIAQILEIKGENVFKVRAYARAAENIERLNEDLEIFARDSRLQELPGIGRDLSNKIQEYLSTDKIKTYAKLKKSIPPGLLDLLNIPSVGPKTVKLLYEKLKIKNIADLERAIKKNLLTGIFGIKEKTISNILKGIEAYKRGRERMTLARAMLEADQFVKRLEKFTQVEKISTAGSLRRQKETVRDIDILIVSQKPKEVMRAFVGLAPVKDILAFGETKSSVRSLNDVQIDCRVVEPNAYGAALLYFTGSKNFNIKLRKMAQKLGLKINEYGLFSAAGGQKEKFICGSSEEKIFKALGLEYIEPELREDNGEIELALKNKLPRLIELTDIKGDLHTHSTWSDGKNSIFQMAQAAKNLGLTYIAITDHSRSLKIARGLELADLKKKKKEIDKINASLKNFRLLYATEVDIDSQGNIDYKDEILREFDLVVAAIHTGFKQKEEQLTKRTIKACQNKYVHIIAHPTGRLWPSRDAYNINLEEVFKAAAGTNTALEINAFPDRLDLNSRHCRMAKESGAKIAIGTDAHRIEHLNAMELGVSVARRGWLSAGDVINTLPIDKLLKNIKK